MAVWLLWTEESKGLGTALVGDFHEQKTKKGSDHAINFFFIFFYFLGVTHLIVLFI